MTDDLHEDLARRLRDEGNVPAPADLRPEVMAQVAAEPRRSRTQSRNRWWRPALGVAAVACGVAGLVIGLSNLGGTPSSSSASSGSSSAALGQASQAAGAGAGSASALPASPQTYTVTPLQATRALGPGVAHGTFDDLRGAATKVPSGLHTFNLYLPPKLFNSASKKLATVERQNDVPSYSAGNERVRIVLHRRGGH